MPAPKPLRISLATGRGGAPKALYLVLEWEGMIAAIRSNEEGDGAVIGGGELYATVSSMVKGQSDLNPEDFTYANGTYSVIVSGAMRTFTVPPLLRESEVVEVAPTTAEGAEPSAAPAELTTPVPSPSVAVAEATSPPVPVEDHPTTTTA